MRGLITSGRCLECKRRKRKCDERKPVCKTCSVAGVPCVWPEVTKFLHIFNDDVHQQGRKSVSPENNKPVCLDMDVFQIRTANTTTMTPPRDHWTFESWQVDEIQLNEDVDRIKHVVYNPKSTKKPKSKLKAKQKTSEKDPCLNVAVSEKSPALSPLARPALTEAERLACRLVSIWEETGRPSSPLSGAGNWLWGSWPLYVPARIGRSKLLDTTIGMMTDGFEWLSTREPELFKRVFRDYGKALQLLSFELNRGIEGVTGELIAAMEFLKLFEVSIGQSGVSGYSAHGRGAVSCFLARGADFCKEDLERALFYSTYGFAIRSAPNSTFKAFYRGKWETVGCAPTKYTYGSYPNELEARRRVVTILPRLIGFVRQLKTNSDPKLLEWTTIHLQEILAIDWKDSIVEIPSEASILPPSEPCIGKDIESETLCFPTMQQALVFAYHLTARITVSGLCQQLYSYDMYIEGMPDLPLLREEDLRCARLISMTVPQISNAGISMAALSKAPLEAAWSGIWRYRNQTCACAQSSSQEKYPPATTPPDTNPTKAANLQHRLDEQLDRVERMMNWHTSREDRISFSEALQGGTLLRSCLCEQHPRHSS